MRSVKNKKIQSTIIFGLQIIITSIFLTGCWNNRDVTDINMVAGLGLERRKKGKYS